MATFCVTVAEGEEERRVIEAFSRREGIAHPDPDAVERVLADWVRTAVLDLEAALAAEAAREQGAGTLGVAPAGQAIRGEERGGTA
ncbi:MAG: hypothetical protein ACKOWF_01965 [Chloroflexota bacterium]